MVKIVQSPNPVLRNKARDVPKDKFGSKELEQILANMKEALRTQDDGVALAAPQIGISLRIFVISKKVIPNAKSDIVCINPAIVRLGKKKERMSEGCLSVRWKYGMVKRSTTATIRAYNEKGNEFVLSGKGLLAQIFQHEIDHLDGILFIDTATDIQDMPPEQHNHE